MADRRIAEQLFLPPLLMILFRQKYPRWWIDRNPELLRFTNRIGIYTALMDDRYPSTDEHQSVRLDVSYPDAQRDLNPLAADREVVPRDPALHRAVLPLSATPGSSSPTATRRSG
jgi:hypothetical protein